MICVTTKIKTKVEPKTNLQMTNEQYFKSALSFFGYKIDDKFAKIITEVFPLVQSKGGEVTIMDLCKVMAELEPEIEAKTEPSENVEVEQNPQNEGETDVAPTKYPEEEEVILTGVKFDVHLQDYIVNKTGFSKTYDYNSKLVFDCLKFSSRTKNALEMLGVKTLRHLYEWRVDTLIRQRGVGNSTIVNIQEVLKMYRLPLLS